MPDLAKKQAIDNDQSVLWGWKPDLYIDAVGQVSMIAGLAVLAGFIVTEIMSKNSGALPGRKVV